MNPPDPFSVPVAQASNSIRPVGGSSPILPRREPGQEDRDDGRPAAQPEQPAEDRSPPAPANEQEPGDDLSEPPHHIDDYA